MLSHRRYLLLPLLLLGLSCSSEPGPLSPGYAGGESWLRGGIALDTAEQSAMEGIYRNHGSGRFGEEVVLKWSDDYPTIFCGGNNAYFILNGARVGDSIVFEGFWRYAYEARAGRARLTIGRAEGAGRLLGIDSASSSIVIRGTVESEDGGNEEVVLALDRSLPVADTGFLIVGHRGGGRNADFHPYSENSLEMIRYAGRLGCNGVEIDVRSTADGVPILLHDEELSERLVRGDHLVGPVGNYTLEDLRLFGRLAISGESIPTLEQALKMIVRETELRFVWLDVKSAAVLGATITIVQEALRDAEAEGRRVEILIGLPFETAEVFDAYVAAPEEGRPKAIAEVYPERVQAADATVWAPRWTTGLQEDVTAQMHAEGRRVIPWTLESESLIREFLSSRLFDGLLTDYPTVVAYEYYMGR